MFLTKLKTATVVLAMLGVVTLTCGMLAGKGDGPDKLSAKGEPEKTSKKATTTTPDPKADALWRERKKFEGTWRIVSVEVNGKKQAKKDFGTVMFVDGTTGLKQAVEVRKDFGSVMVFDGEGRWKTQKADGSTTSAGTSEIDLVAKPRSIQCTGTSKGDNEKKTARQIYEFIDANSLRMSKYTSEEERPKDFSTKPGSGRIVDLWERVKKPTPNEIDDAILDRLKKLEVKELKVPKEVLQKRVEAARRVYQQNMLRVQNVAGLPAELFGWSERWLESELALCDKESERVKALRDHLDRTRDVERITGTSARAGQGRQADADAATYFRLEAEIRLYKEGVKPHPVKDPKNKTAP